MTALVKCEFLQDNICSAISDNAEAKEVRNISCSNDNEQACCYLCALYNRCQISCNYLGKNKNKPKSKTQVISENTNPSFLRCLRCESKMLHSEVKLRVGGWTGFAQLFPLGSLGELGEEVFPVIMHVCPNCGKIEFTAKEKTQQKIIDRS